MTEKKIRSTWIVNVFKQATDGTILAHITTFFFLRIVSENG